MTWKCNFFCDHCIHECGPNEDHMTDDQLQRIWDFLVWLKTKNYKIVVLGLTGGEPTLHPKFWNHILPNVDSFRKLHQINRIELHTNASQPVPDHIKNDYCKHFGTVFVGHYPFHRKFKSLSELYLQDYTDISVELILRYDKYKMAEGIYGMSIKEKGRAAKMIPSGKYINIPAFGYPKMECVHDRSDPGTLNVSFTPDHINYCGEKGHPLPNSSGDEGQFHPYILSNEEIIHNSLTYSTNYCKSFCSQKCVALWVKENSKSDLTTDKKSVE